MFSRTGRLIRKTQKLLDTDSKISFDENVSPSMNNKSHSNNEVSGEGNVKNNGKFKCKYCDKHFRQKHNGLIHERNHELTKKPFQCEKCEKNFTRATTLRIHYRKMHNMEPPPKGKKEQIKKKRTDMPLRYMCRFCSKLFRQAAGLKLHEQVHTQEKPFSCKYCGKKFIRKFTQESHEKKHEGKHLCQICNKSLSSSWSLQVHLQSHDKQHMCEMCGLKCSTAAYLKLHLQTHSIDAKPVEKSFHCDECSYATRSASELRKHMVRHTGQKPYECEHCHRKFSRQNALKEHRIVHKAGRLHSCEICGSNLLSRNSFRHHVRTQHPELAESVIKKWEEGLHKLIALMNKASNEVDKTNKKDVTSNRGLTENICLEDCSNDAKDPENIAGTLDPDCAMYKEAVICDIKSSDKTIKTSNIAALSEPISVKTIQQTSNTCSSTFLNQDIESELRQQDSKEPENYVLKIVKTNPKSGTCKSVKTIGSTSGIIEALPVMFGQTVPIDRTIQKFSTSSHPEIDNKNSKSWETVGNVSGEEQIKTATEDGVDIVERNKSIAIETTEECDAQVVIADISNGAFSSLTMEAPCQTSDLQAKHHSRTEVCGETDAVVYVDSVQDSGEVLTPDYGGLILNSDTDDRNLPMCTLANEEVVDSESNV